MSIIYDSIRYLGIYITEDDIKQLANEKGIAGTLNCQQKAMLTLELVTKKSE